MLSSFIYDNRTLFVKCDCASVDQIRKSFNEALTTYQTANNIDLKCRFRVNLVETREGVTFGIAFVFVTNPSVYHMLLGKNPDGSDRVEYRDDPSWTPPVKGEIVNDSGWSSISLPVFTPGMSWADMDDLESEYERKINAEKKKNTCPKIPVPLEPLMVLPPYQLTEQQIAEKRAKIIEDNNGKPGFDPKLIDIPSLAHLSVYRAMACPVDYKFMPNILKCKGVPEWITKDDLKMQFSPYATDSTSIKERTVKGRRVDETYPFVNINEDRVAFIIFDPSTNDALFALHMTKKLVITKRDGNGALHTATLMFGHSYRTDRDIMSDINQTSRAVNRKHQPHTNQYQNNRAHQRTRGSSNTISHPGPNSRNISNKFDVLGQN